MRPCPRCARWSRSELRDAPRVAVCTDVGGFNGVGVEIPCGLFVTSGSVVFDVCDEHCCALAAQRLRPVPEGPVGCEAGVTVDDLGRDFEPGPVMLTGADGELVAAARRTSS